MIDLPVPEGYKKGGGDIHYKKKDLLRNDGVVFYLTKDHLREWSKCQDDPIYFLKTYTKITHPSKGQIPFDLYEPQEELIRLYNSNDPDQRFIISKVGRQLGKTQLTAGYFVWLILFNKHKFVGISAHQLSGATEVLKRVKEMYETVPIWMQQGIKKWDVQTILLENGSSIITGATTGSGFRGKAISILYIDEMAFIPNGVCREFMTATIPAISSGNDTKVFITSTPKGYNEFYTYWTGAENINNPGQKDWNGYTPFEYDYRTVPGRDEKWVEMMRKQLQSETRFNQEVMCKFLGSSDTLINGQMLEMIKVETASQEPFEKKLVNEASPDSDIIIGEEDYSQYSYWEKPQNGSVYMACVDVAEGIGGDYSTINIFDISQKPYRSVFIFKGNRISPERFATVIDTMGREYNNAFVLLEENQAKQIPHILKKSFSYPNMIHTKGSTFGVQMTFNQTSSSTVGVKINKNIKETGCLKLKQMIEERMLIVQDREIFFELASFIRKDNGTFSADEGANDDLVSTMVLFAWATTQNIFGRLAGAVSAYDLQRMRDEYKREKALPAPSMGYDDPYNDEYAQDEEARFWSAYKRINDEVADGESGYGDIIDGFNDMNGLG